jgi:long-chain acyl-CoA synthetase
LHQKIEEEGGVKKKLFYAGLDNSARLREKEAAHKDRPWSHLTNRVYDKLVFSKVKERFGGRMKYAFSGGAALAPDVAQFIDHLNIVVYEGYGLSETSPIISANHPGEKIIGSVGRPIPGVTVKLDYSKGTMPGEGEIINYGPNNMQGYYHLPKETAETLMPDGGLRTGDLGRMDENGYLYVTGRVKDLYKLENGKYVAPVPLEEELQLSPFILQAMLYGTDLPYNIALVVPELPNLHAFCRERGMPEEPLEELIQRPAIQLLLEEETARIAANWKSYERPRKVVPVADEWTVDNDLLTPTLKVKRRKVVAKYKDLLTLGDEERRRMPRAHVRDEVSEEAPSRLEGEGRPRPPE